MRTDITQEEHDALIIVRNALASGKLEHVDYDALFDSSQTERVRVRTSKLPFNMNTTGSAGPCGTAACIGGWMHIAMNKPDLNEPTLDLEAMSDYVFDKASPALVPLFFAEGTEFEQDLGSITTSIAVNMIDEFLAKKD